ncbi:MAG: hypothetical protein J6Y29_00830 [Clostridiales bacterium]|nr:hypothetical protein [Clostridiales bacterium]
MVIQKKNWETKQIDEEKVQEIKNKVDIPYFLAKVLSTMDMKIDEIPDFLNPNFEKYKSKDPFLLSGMKESVERILYAIDKKEKIVVFGDSDADGLTGTAILYDFLTKIADKTKIDYYIIDRENEGYGLSDRAVNRVLKKKPNLIITVDCGTTDVEAV